MTMRTLCFVVAAMGGLASTAGAAEYWITYEGNDFPETEGWERYVADETGYGHGGADRSIQDGVLNLDSLRDSLIWDYYRIDRSIDPDPGDLFVAEWRLKITESVTRRDAGLAFARDGIGTLEFQYTADEMVSTRAGVYWRYPITPYEFHTYRIESSDMIHYSLWIDGDYVRDGEWDLRGLNRSFVIFGDIARGGGATSYSEWDYFRFGTIPEPSSLALLAGVVLVNYTRRFRDA